MVLPELALGLYWDGGYLQTGPQHRCHTDTPEADRQREAAPLSTDSKPDSGHNGSVDQAWGKVSRLHRGWTGLEMVEGGQDLATGCISQRVSLVPLA